MDIEKHQRRLLRDIGKAGLRPSSPPLIDAFIRCPRHRFVHAYRFADEAAWSEFELTEEHLDRVYRDEPLVISGTGGHSYQSSNSQPSYILDLVEKLDIADGNRVLEIGSGSGWLAAIMSSLVGSGEVVGVEVLAELAERSRQDIRALGIDNVHIITGDGASGATLLAGQFDKAIVTTASYNIPDVLFDRIKRGGWLILPIRMIGIGDVICLFVRTETGFQAIDTKAGYFVPMQAPASPVDIIDVSQAPRWQALKAKPASVRPMWWGQSDPALDFLHMSAGFRAYLTIVDCDARAFRIKGEGESRRQDLAFGFIDPAFESAGLVTAAGLCGYGTAASMDQLNEHYTRWSSFGMPTAANFDLEVSRTASDVISEPGTRMENRLGQGFHWTLIEDRARLFPAFIKPLEGWGEH